MSKSVILGDGAINDPATASPSNYSNPPTIPR
jgi:hypothetical protein